MSKKLKEDGTMFVSGQAPKSSIILSTFQNNLNTITGGWRTIDKNRAKTNLEKKLGIQFVNVDLSNDAYRVHNAAIGSVFNSQKFNDNLERLFDAYVTETSLRYDSITDRQRRLNELKFAYLNDVDISNVVQLTADEATQQDVQDRLITCESPNTNFTRRVYSLMNQWGVTQTKVNTVCRELELYGESFWTHKVGLNGIERIKYLRPSNIKEVLDFDPTKMAEYLSERDGWKDTSNNSSRMNKIKKLVDLVNTKDGLDEAESLAAMFDTKLLGYELEGDIVCPPWMITHFRLEPEEFYPYGRPPLLNALAPFKQAHSTMALQGLARMMSFPLTLYKVKTGTSISPTQVWSTVNNTREKFDNLGVSVSQMGSECYTVNTKIWIPEDFLDVQVVENKTQMDFIGDLENYQKRVAKAAGVPVGYIDPTADSWGESGISLMEQYKPFARHVYTIQSAFLEGLGKLIRLHFAITGEFDYNTQFVLSMRFPAEEETDSKRSAQSSSIDLTKAVIELIQTVLGLEEDDPLPEDVVTDIISKYSFLDPTDIQKWISLTNFSTSMAKNKDDGDVSDSGGDEGGGDEGGGDEPVGEEEAAPAQESYADRRKRLREKRRMREIRKAYRENSEGIYMRFIEENGLQEWSDPTKGRYARHHLLVRPVYQSDVDADTYRVMRDESRGYGLHGYGKIREEVSLGNALSGNIPEDMPNVADRQLKQAFEDFDEKGVGI